jgi:hypothetical protein
MRTIGIAFGTAACVLLAGTARVQPRGEDGAVRKPLELCLGESKP